MDTESKIFWFVLGAASCLAALFIAAHIVGSTWDSCQESGGFVHDNQYYECHPTGKWVE